MTAASGAECAARLLGAAQALRDREGYARAAAQSSRWRADVSVVRRRLSVRVFEAAFARGADLSIEEAAAQAGRAIGLRRRPAGGWSSLTGSERKVAVLVAEGLTNRQVAERLFVAPATVKNHLSHIFSKLAVARRSELAVLAWQRRERPPAADCGAPGSRAPDRVRGREAGE